jgi:hypothetical protein
MTTSTVDWSVHDEFPEMECTCDRGCVFTSHAKVVFVHGETHMTLVARKPCPTCGVCARCGMTHLRGARSGVIRETIR